MAQARIAPIREAEIIAILVWSFCDDVLYQV